MPRLPSALGLGGAKRTGDGRPGQDTGPAQVHISPQAVTMYTRLLSRGSTHDASKGEQGYDGI
eukprot:scaffold6298_cov151-Isochrysis_galbana.AAC.1